MSRALLPLLAVLLAGCAATGHSDFTCSYEGPGVGCRPASDVLQAGEQGRIEALRAQTQAAARGETPATDSSPAATSALEQPVASTRAADPFLAPYIDDGRVPVRMPAGVMRIWVNSFTDQGGDLYMPGYVYTELEQRRWSVGLPPAPSDQSVLPFKPAGAPTLPEAAPPPVSAAPRTTSTSQRPAGPMMRKLPSGF